MLPMPSATDRTEILGVDIGGANLKYATEDGRCFDRSFPMWTRFNDLGEQLAADITRFPGTRYLVVTMTGELADCFLSRAAGVAHIVDHVMRCVAHASITSAVFYGTDGQFHSDERAKQNWECVAASNWHALAMCVGKHIATDALLIDVGSTTTDVIAIRGGEVLTQSRTDFERLADQSLVYVGCRRTPVCALVSSFSLNGSIIPVMNEMFATIDDARLLIGLQAEDPTDCLTADQQPRDRENAHARLARMIGLDADQMTQAQTRQLALQIVQAALTSIAAATQIWWQRLLSQTQPTPACILSGHGQELVVAPASCHVIDLKTFLPPGVSRAAPAWAVALMYQGGSFSR